MGRQDYQYLSLSDMSGGINQREGLARPNELKVAKNVWFRDGILQQRPGFVGWNSPSPQYVNNAVSGSTTAYMALEDPVGGTFLGPSNSSATLTFGAAYKAVGARAYFGSTTYIIDYFDVLFASPGNLNTSSSYGLYEYWNGSIWAFLKGVSFQQAPSSSSGVYNGISVTIFGGTNGAPTHWGIQFPVPQDWATTSVNGTTAYWIRMTIQNSAINSTTLRVGANAEGFSTQFNASTGSAMLSQQAAMSGSYDSPAFKSALWYFLLEFGTGSTNLTTLQIVQAGKINLSQQLSTTNITTFANPGGGYNSISSAQSIISGDLFVSFNGVVFEFRPNFVNLFQVAQVETDPNIVGPLPSGSFVSSLGLFNVVVTVPPYSPSLVPQLGAVPQARFLKFISSRLWAAGIDSEPQALRWTAPFPNHRVWPSLNLAYAAGADSTPITGLGTVGENLVVYKNDSVWNVVDQGVDSGSGLEDYGLIKTVSGTGCVAHNSIQEMGGHDYFLGHDGVYTYNGTSAQCISERILPLIRGINQGRRQGACAAVMHTEDSYFLAVPTGNNVGNDTILVYRLTDNTDINVLPYGQVQGSWWQWTLPKSASGTQMYCQCLYTLRSPDRGEEMFMQDQNGQIYKWMVGLTDNGATVTPTVETHDFLRNQALTQNVVRSVIVSATNELTALTAQVIPDGQEGSPTSGTINLADSVDQAPQGFTFSGQASPSFLGNSDVRERRLNFYVQCKRFHLLITHSVKNQMLKLQSLIAGYSPHGKH